MIAICVVLGAAIGGLLRFGLQTKLDQVSGIPWGTLVGNFLGCFLMGIAAHYTKSFGMFGKALIVTGLLGSLTTLSSFTWQVFKLVQDRLFIQAFSYWLSTSAGGVLACWIGYVFGRRF